MRKLSRTAYQEVVDHLRAHARPLEQARLAFHLEGDSPRKVLMALAPFQNEDGGFGRGLEPDVRLHASSVIATTIALQTLRATGIDSDQTMVAAAARYLIANYDETVGTWINVPPHVDDAPHAPWWTYQPDAAAQYQPNPSAEIAGYLVERAALFPTPLVARALADAKAPLAARPDPLEMHDFLCYLRLLESPRLDADSHALILERLQTDAAQRVKPEPGDWTEYGLKPLDVVSSPDSPLYPSLRTGVERQLDHEIGRLESTGMIAPNWSWDFIAADSWAEAQREWTGVLTLDLLLKLRIFDRLEQ